jgi:hypothetical protein
VVPVIIILFWPQIVLAHALAKMAKTGYKSVSHQPPALRPRTMKYRTLVCVNSTGVLVEAPHSDLEAKFLGEAAYQRFD